VRKPLEAGTSRIRSYSNDKVLDGQERSQHRTWAIVLVALILLAALVFEAPSVPAAVKEGSSLVSQFVSSLSGSSNTITTGGDLNYTIYAPLIYNGLANVSYPSDYGALSAYALALINSDRANNSLGPVNMTLGIFAQQHADSMLEYGYFSHNDTQGFEPYMRYTLLGGRGAVEENVAYAYASAPQFTATSAVELELRALEWTMMNNDLQCCNNGHRDNILAGLHNEVSIGVAFNSTRLYFVEDFINYYIDLNFSVSSSYYVTMSGTPLAPGLSPDAVYVTYDQPPTPETPAQLNAGPHEYSDGMIVGGVLPPCELMCPAFAQAITVRADNWVFTNSSISVTFSLATIIRQYGAGVYTVYMVTGTDLSTAITSISVFVS